MQKETLVPGSISEEELIRLVDTYSGVLLGLCRLTLGDTAMAQDIVQETFLKAWKKGGFRQESEKAWLIKVAMNLCHGILISMLRQFLSILRIPQLVAYIQS